VSDLAKSKVHGPVATLRTESAEWDADRQDWKPARYFILTSFRRDGAIDSSETHSPGGSIAHSRWLYDSASRLTESDAWMNDEPAQKVLYFYDEAGRHIRTASLRDDGSQTDFETSTYDADGKETKIRLLPITAPPNSKDRAGNGATSIGYSIEGTDMMLGAPGAATMATTYAGAGRPARVIFEDANHNPLHEVRFTRDASGRPLTIETTMGESQFNDFADQVSADHREVAAAVLKQILGDAFSRTTYTYDSRGRVIERTNSMGTMSDEHTTYRYDDDHDEAVEEITETRTREATVDDNGDVRYKHDTVSTQHNRFEYRYDTHGNWTEQIVSYQNDPNADFQRSNIERRVITYFVA
jgi:YD repeat-containing protein